MATVTFIRNRKQSAGALGGVKRYVEQEKKTIDASGAQLVSGQNCTPQFADKEFLATRMIYHKDSPVYFYHYTQSFSPDENITGQQAHEIAREFAARAWPDSEVLIATHVDAAHIHSHFIVNAVCFESGKMLRQGPNTLKGLRQISDELCVAHGLSVLPPDPEQKTNGMSAREYRSAEKGQSWKLRLMAVIDECMAYAESKEEFIDLMRSEGYQVKWTDERKYITYTTPGGQRCRENKLHEEKYLKENMEYEFSIRQNQIYGGTEGPEPAGPDYGGADRAVRHSDRAELESGDLAPQWSAPAPGTNGGNRRHADDRRGRGGSPAADSRVSDKPAEGSEPTCPVLHHTGWESEREFFYRRRYGDQGFGESDPQLDAYRQDLDHPDSGDFYGLDYVAGTFTAVAVTVAALDDTGPVQDATTMRQHIDSKAYSERQRKRIALGHKPDDHEDEPTWTMSM